MGRKVMLNMEVEQVEEEVMRGEMGKEQGGMGGVKLAQGGLGPTNNKEVAQYVGQLQNLNNSNLKTTSDEAAPCAGQLQNPTNL